MLKKKILDNIPINIKNQHQLLNLLSEGYKSLSKALMEYIDNAFDSAEDFYDDNKKIYTKDVYINVVIDRENNLISIKDNCLGMDLTILKGLANSINDSEKKRREQKRAWVNGQFGLGAHAFRFFAQELNVTSKQENQKLISISIDCDSPNAEQFQSEDMEFFSSGTLVELLKINKYKLKHLQAEELKQDIETYFEMLLHRNVTIKINDGEEEYVCKPYDYNSLVGKEITKIIKSWKEGSMSHSVAEDKGVIVNLKVCTDKVDKPPFFARKGRRINYISYLDSFIRKTTHRRKVWENYYLTGYIEVQDNLEPVITRDDFKAGKGYQQKRTGIYEEIVKLEDDIYSAIETINKDKSDQSLRNLASRLTDILSELAKEEELNLQYQGDGNKNKSKEKVKIKIDPNSEDFYKVKTGKRIGSGSSGGGHEEVVTATPDSKSTTIGKRIERQSHGVRIEFSTLPSDERTHYGDGVITIFTNHPDFVLRKGATQQAELGSMKITARLANYLAAIISSEFKEIFYLQKKLEPNRKSILSEQVDFIFKLEDKMKDYIDQPLYSLGKLKK